MKSELSALNTLTICGAIFSFAVFIPDNPMGLYDWLSIIFIYTVYYIFLLLFINHGRIQKPLADMIILIYILYLFSKQIYKMLQYIKMFHGNSSGTAVLVVSLLTVIIMTLTDTRFSKLAFPLFVFTTILILFARILNIEKISILNLYQHNKTTINISNKTLFDYIIPYAITANSFNNCTKKKTINLVLLANMLLVLITIFVFACFHGDLLYSLSPLQALFQISATELIKNYDAFFNFLLFFSFFASITVISYAYKVIKSRFRYFSRFDILLIIPFMILAGTIAKVAFYIEILMTAIIFFGKDKGKV